jgi:hypothetical protein
MTENEVTVMMAEAIDQDRQYAPLTCSTKHLMIFAEMVAEKERDKVTKERDRMCEHCKWRNDENSTLDETNQPKILGKG